MIYKTLDPDKTYYLVSENSNNRTVIRLTFLRLSFGSPNYAYVVDRMLDEPMRIYLPKTELYESEVDALSVAISRTEDKLDSLLKWKTKAESNLINIQAPASLHTPPVPEREWEEAPVNEIIDLSVNAVTTILQGRPLTTEELKSALSVWDAKVFYYFWGANDTLFIMGPAI